jgi:MFS family permease
VSRPVSAASPAASPLRNGAFLALLLYRAFAGLSYQVVAVTVGWHIYTITRDPFALGLVGLAEVLPYFCVAPFAGYLVDHSRRRTLGAVACLGLLATALALAGIAHTELGMHATWPIYAAIALTGTVRSFLTPVYNALFARVLRRDQFVRGASFGSVVFQMSLVIGPALGGVLVGWGGVAEAYTVAGVFAACAAAAVFWLKVTEPPLLLQRAPVFSSIHQGMKFVWGNQIMLGAMALDMFCVLLGGAVSMLPAFIREILHWGPEGLGILRAMPAVGSICVALWLARHPLQKNAGRVLMYSVAGFGLCTIAFGLSREFWLSAGILVVYGMCDGVSVVMRSTILQLATPDDMRGRVSSINGIFIGSSNELGAFYDGVMARLVGLVPAVVIGGCVTLGVVASTWKLAPRLRNLDLRELQ